MTNGLLLKVQVIPVYAIVTIIIAGNMMSIERGCRVLPPCHKNAAEMPQNVPIFARFCVWLPTLGNDRKRLVFQLEGILDD
jgi:hypothetical protein